MKLETFFEKFDLFAAAPDAVENMRELVLELAIQGNLVERRVSEGNGHTLLKELRTLPPERNSKSRSPKDITVEPETLLEIPDHWALTTVENTTRQTGFFSDGDWVESKDQDPAGGVRLIQLADVGDGEYRDRSSRFMTKEAAKRLNCSYLEAGDILIARMPDPLGRCCRFPGDPKPAVTVVDVCILRPNIIFFDPDFLVFAINCPHFRRLVSAQATGTTRSRISRNNLGVLPIPLPPLTEQKRIVAKVDELMALCDRLEAQQKERKTRHAALARASLARFADTPTSANLEFLFHDSYSIPPIDLRKSILTLAVQGKLVPQDPEDEPAENVLAKVLKDRARQEKSLRIKEPSSIEADVEHMPELPCGWCYASPDQMTAFHKNALTIGPFGSSLLKSDYMSAGVPLVFVRDIRSESFGGAETRFVSQEKAKELASHTVKTGDLLITKMGDPPGDTAIYPAGRPIGIITADCIKLTPHTNLVSAEYLRFIIRTSQISEQFAGITQGVAQQKVSLSRFRCIAVPIPPLAEQRRIVSKVDQLMTLVNELETQLAISQTTSKKLLEAIVVELTTESSSVNRERLDLARISSA